MSSSSSADKILTTLSPSDKTTQQQVEFAIIVAATQRGGIGFQNELPWKRKLSVDLEHFQQVTTDTGSNQHAKAAVNVVIMGGQTWRSIPEHVRPLKHRINVIVSRTLSVATSDPATTAAVVVVSSFQEAIQCVDAMILSGQQQQQQQQQIARVFCMGGSDMYAHAMRSQRFTKLYLTRVMKEFPCDRYLSNEDMHANFEIDALGDVQMEQGIPFQFQEWTRIPQEMQYLNMVRNILQMGTLGQNRTGVDTLSVFGREMHFCLRDGRAPLISTKKMKPENVLLELIWFLEGKTDAVALAKSGCSIWLENSTRAELDKRAEKETDPARKAMWLNRREGDCGPIYGYVWRHWGHPYVDCDTDYTGQGLDQIAKLIHTLRTDPTSRRAIVTSWDPRIIDDGVLPPCHSFMQWNVLDGELSCKLTQRSCDVGLGANYNSLSYAMFVMIIANIVGLKPGEFIHSCGNTHIYDNHIQALRGQLERTPAHQFPRMRITKQLDSVDNLKLNDFELIDEYKPQAAIRMKMAV